MRPGADAQASASVHFGVPFGGAPATRTSQLKAFRRRLHELASAWYRVPWTAKCPCRDQGTLCTSTQPDTNCYLSDDNDSVGALSNLQSPTEDWI